MANSKVKRPASAIPGKTGLVTMAAIPLVHYLWPAMPDVSSRDQAALFVLTIFVILVLSERALSGPHRSLGSGLVFNPANFQNSGYLRDYLDKLVGLAATLALLAAFYSTADLYKDPWYQPFFSLVADFWPLILGVVLINVTAVHFSMRHRRDGLWQLGRLVLAPTAPRTESRGLKVYLLSLCIKGYFLPLMFCYLVEDWTYLASTPLWDSAGFPDVYQYLFRFSFFFDLTIVVIGYATATRLLNSHIRWTETSVGGWLVCIACYAPFWQLLSREYFNYDEDGFTWGVWLGDYPVLYALWGSTILALLAIYAMSEARMGLRFSNLTYRGLACDFPYNISKHPAYLSKNLSWWMISIPFFAVDFWTGLANCLALLGVNFIYFMRAWYEERCLSKVPSYRAYKRHIDQNGLIARLKGLIVPRGLAAHEVQRRDG
ncbi:hypothetical protein [Ruegeria sp.]|uniref:hypothetical protein n=1 Tax=Ruegeria sp. TaxID=1879320 RepID=UPI003B5A3917